MTFKRPETGPMQFGDDYPGVFIRGDNACWWGFILKQYLDGRELGPINKAGLAGLANTLCGCDIRKSPDVQRAVLETPSESLGKIDAILKDAEDKS